jgi:hypothetical protein
MKNISDFIGDVTKRVSSRKFQVLVLSIAMHLNNPMAFTGDHLVIVFGIYIGGNVFEKFVLREKA